MEDNMDIPEQRVTISIATLRAELGQLELRLVDRLNIAVQGKADIHQLVDVERLATANAVRLTALESTVVTPDRVALMENQVSNLQSIAGYKKWLYTQTAAIIAVAAAIVGLVVHG
jgi:hypothetical protein